MAIFVLFILLLLAAATGLLGALKASSYNGVWAVAGILAIPLAFLVLFAGGVNSVPSRSLGIPVSFGRIGTPLTPGFHWEWPWVSVADVNETVHTVTFKQGLPLSSDSPGDVTDTCLSVRIGGQQTGCLDITLQYKVNPAGASVLFADYQGQSHDIMNTIVNKLIIREEEQVVNQVFDNYNPIQDVAANTGAGNSQFSTFAPQVKSAMVTDLAGRVDVLAVITPFMHYDTATQDRLNQIQQQYGQTAIAQEQIKTNQAQAKANAAIAASVSHDPQVLAYQCLQIAEAAIKAGDTAVQPGWCFGSSGVIASTGK